MMRRWLYSILLHLLMPWAAAHLLRRAWRQPQYLRGWGERFGVLPPRPPGPLIWIHAVSVGETRAAQPLIAALQQRFADHRILLTHMTPTGRAAAQQLFGAAVSRCYLPYDLPWAVRRFVHHYRPQIGLIMETELWPNLIHACHARGTPLLLVNARMSEKSARRYRRHAALTRMALQQLSALAAASEEDARRLQELGAGSVEVHGNMKFDVEPPPQQLSLAQELRRRIGTRPLFLCASTRDGEEKLIIDAWCASGAAQTSTLLALAPRHPQRFDEVAAMVAAAGLKLQRRSCEGEVAAAVQVWLADSLGEMYALYAVADVAFVGGSLVPCGGQNFIEACAVGVPVLLGPSTFNFAVAANDAVAASAAQRLATAPQVVAEALQLLGDEGRRQRMGRAGAAFAAQQRGATQRCMQLIERFIPPAGR